MSIKLPDFEQAKILVLGDIMLDRYWQGDTSRISPEAPVPIVHVQSEKICPGGAANVALNIASLGGSVYLLGLIGEDEEGSQLSAELNRGKIISHLTTIPEKKTITKLRVLSFNQQLIRLDFEDRFTKEHSLSLLTAFEKYLPQIDVVVLSDYGKGTITDPQPFIQAAKKHNRPILIDPKGKTLHDYRGATLITPNRKEFEAMVGPFDSENKLVALARTAMQQNQIDHILVTRGDQGMSLIPNNGNPIHLPAKAREVFDVTGAGDTVIGVFACTLASAHSYEQAMKFANLAAGITVGKLGAATVNFAELKFALQQEDSSHRGVFNCEELLDRVHDAKQKGEKIVFTNGCFDILHAGHVDYMIKAKAFGDRLIVALNDDDSVRRLKGPTRPVIPLNLRMPVIAGLESVDWVVPFSEDTPMELIKLIQPDVLVKGGDYTLDTVVGAKEVVAYGGKVALIPFVNAISTSHIVERIKQTYSEDNV